MVVEVIIGGGCHRYGIWLMCADLLIWDLLALNILGLTTVRMLILRQLIELGVIGCGGIVFHRQLWNTFRKFIQIIILSLCLVMVSADLMPVHAHFNLNLLGSATLVFEIWLNNWAEGNNDWSR